MSDGKTETTTRDQVLDAQGPEVRHPITKVTTKPAFEPTPIDDARKAFLKRQFCPPNCSAQDFEFFLAWCERTGLDPVTKQAYLVERTANGVTRYEPMASIGGLYARASAFTGYRGMLSGAVFEGDECTIDFVSGEVVHKANVTKRGKLIGAWAKVLVDGRNIRPTWLTVAQRIQTKKDWDTKAHVPTQFWARDPAGQLQKCCEAEQFRKAGIADAHIAEEMILVDEKDVTPSGAQPAPSEDTAAGIADRLRASRPGADSVKQSQVVDVEVVHTPKAEPTRATPKTIELTPVDMTKVNPDKTPSGPTAVVHGGGEGKGLHLVEQTVREVSNPPDAVAMVRALDAEQRRLATETALAWERKFGLTALEIEGQKIVAGSKVYEQWAKENPDEATARANALAVKAQATSADRVLLDPTKVVIFGEGRSWKGKPIETLTGPDLLEAKMLGASKLPGLPENKAGPVRMCVAAIEARMAAMERELLPPEPGSDG